MSWSIVFFSVSLGALLGAPFRFPLPIFLAIPFLILFLRKKPLLALSVSLILFFGVYTSILRVPPGEYEFVALVERSYMSYSKLVSVKVLDGKRWRRASPMKVKGALTPGSHVYLIGYYDGNVVRPRYLREVKVGSPLSNSIAFREKFLKDVENETLGALLFGVGKSEKVTKSGLAHLFAVSGFHIGVIFFLHSTLFSIFNWRKFLNDVLSFCVMLPYVLGVGAPSAYRAFLTLVVWRIFKMFGVRASPREVTSMVGSVMLALDPTMVTSPSFLLSFFVTLAILDSKNFWSMSLKAYCASLPFLALFFGTTNPFSMLFVFPASVLVGVAVFFSYSSYALYSIGFRATALAASRVCKVLLVPLEYLVDLASRFPSFTLPLATYPLFSVILLITFFYSPDRDRRTSDRGFL